MLKIFLSLVTIVLLCHPLYAEDTIVAKVNGTSLTQKDLEIELDRLIPQITFHRQVSLEKRKMYYPQAIEEMINKELQYEDAVAKGMKPDKEKVEAQMAKNKKMFKSPEDYKAALDKEGVTEAQLKARIERELLIQSAVKKAVIDPSRISESEVKGYYEKNTSKFKEPESIRLRLISTSDEKKVQDILAKLKNGDDIGDVAYKMSEDDYRVKGGDIGYVHRGRLLAEIEEVAFKLPVGQLSDPIKAEDRWYIVKVEDKKATRQLSFEEIKGKLKKELEAERADELRKKWIDNLKTKAKIEVLLKTEF